MEKMKVLFFLCAFIVVHGRENNDVGPYGQHNLWRQTLCERNCDTLNKKLHHCMTLETTYFHDTFQKCLNEILPAIKGSYVLFQRKACKDKTIYHKIDECISEHKAVYTTMNQEAADCFLNVLKKYNLPELIKKYFSFVKCEKK
ncbi:uncharacterized protein [Parasteatoda tepidariorum]|uniref:uncharacterized protein n=1 Tax=Parasteatoda tepidariorum TaxID=114398 RepID=UPI001C71B964|nr:uncharacterized protein LOC110282532 [Parasteatoda tepidariorum]